MSGHYEIKKEGKPNNLEDRKNFAVNYNMKV